MEDIISMTITYVRTSSIIQIEKQTIENQIFYVKRYCELNRINLMEIYKDDGVSGTIPLSERDAGRRLLDDAKNKKFDTILVFKLDRLGRSARDILNVIYELESYGVKIKSLTENFDSSTSQGRFMITMLAAVADMERDSILERFDAGIIKAATQGKWLGGIVPYGYIVNSESYLQVNDSLIPGLNMSESGVIKLIFDLTANQKYSAVKIAKYLNGQGIPTSYSKDGRQISSGKRKRATSGTWDNNAVRRIIRNQTYMGIHVYGKRSKKETVQVIERQVPAIVDESIWQLAQKVLTGNRIESMKNATRDYLLRGLIKCGCCGHSYMGIANNKRKSSYYACCDKFSFKGKERGICKSKYVPAIFIEDLVWGDIICFINNPGVVIEAIRSNVEDIKVKIDVLERDKVRFEKSINAKDNERQRIFDLFRRELITISDVESQLCKIDNEIAELHELIQDLTNQIKAKHNFQQKFASLDDLLTSIKEKVHIGIQANDKREIIKALVKDIFVNTVENPDGKDEINILIKYNFSNN